MFFQVFYSLLFSLSIDYQPYITATLQNISIRITNPSQLLQEEAL